MSANKGRRLKQSLEESNCHDVLWLLSGCGDHSQEAPCYLYDFSPIPLTFYSIRTMQDGKKILGFT
jgi:hypothetical protein